MLHEIKQTACISSRAFMKPSAPQTHIASYSRDGLQEVNLAAGDLGKYSILCAKANVWSIGFSLPLGTACAVSKWQRNKVLLAGLA